MKLNQQPIFRTCILAAMLLLALLALAACSDTNSEQTGTATAVNDSPVFKIGAIPDQNVSTLTRRFDDFAKYIGSRTGLQVEYVPSVDYAALVTAFERGEIHLAWFGGLTGVQARAATPESEAIAQRPRDKEFYSVFIAGADLPVKKLTDLKGLSFTFGSESSTSGHLMPRYYLMQEGIDPAKDFNGIPNFSGSHDKTWKLVESGAFQAGALNEAVWESAIKKGKVDRSKVRAFYTTPPYFDYNWTVNANVNELFGKGTKEKVKDALLDMNKKGQPDILKLFQTDRFIATENENYDAIRRVAEKIGIIK